MLVQMTVTTLALAKVLQMIDDRAQLRAHGYEVEPEVVVNASRGEWGPLFKVPATVFDFFAMLTPNHRSRIIFSLCIDS